jgi:hypothetical protein
MPKWFAEVHMTVLRQGREDSDCWKYPLNPFHHLEKGIFFLLWYDFLRQEETGTLKCPFFLHLTAFRLLLNVEPLYSSTDFTSSIQVPHTITSVLQTADFTVTKMSFSPHPSSRSIQYIDHSLCLESSFIWVLGHHTFLNFFSSFSTLSFLWSFFPQPLKVGVLQLLNVIPRATMRKLPKKKNSKRKNRWIRMVH